MINVLRATMMAMAAASLVLAILGFGTWLCWGLLAGAVGLSIVWWLMSVLIGLFHSLRQQAGSAEGGHPHYTHSPQRTSGPRGEEMVDDFTIVTDFSTGLGTQATAEGPMKVVFLKVGGLSPDGDSVERIFSLGPWSSLRLGLALANAGVQLGEDYGEQVESSEKAKPVPGQGGYL